MPILNLSINGSLSIEDSALIDSLGQESQDICNKFVTQLVDKNSLSGLDFLLSVISRNPMQSQIPLVINRLLLMQKKLERKDPISMIVLEDSRLLTPVREILANFDIEVPIRISKHRRLPAVSKVFLNALQSTYLVFISWWWPRLTGLYKKEPKSSCVLVDTFVLPNSFTKAGDFIDRYYTGYEQYLNDGELDKIYHAPTLVGFRSLTSCIKMARLSKKTKHHFIFQESWLSLSDYLHAMYLSLVLPLKIKNFPLLLEYNIRNLLVNELRAEIFSPALIKAICRFKFVKRLSGAGVDFCQVINWHENQSIDKALNLGFHVHYPGLDIKGYQGYVAPSYWTHSVPQSLELENQLLPDELYVISNHRKKEILANCPNLSVCIASSFRFSYLLDIERLELCSGEEATILIALPIDIEESKGILRACIELQSSISRKITILVKQHPTYSKDKFEKLVPEFGNSAFTAVNDSMSNLLEHITLLISSASSTCAEAVSLGIPVAVYGNRYGVTANPIANTDSEIAQVFYSQEQLAEFINNSLTKNYRRKHIEEFFYIDNGESAKELFVCS